MSSVNENNSRISSTWNGCPDGELIPFILQHLILSSCVIGISFMNSIITQLTQRRSDRVSWSPLYLRRPHRLLHLSPWPMAVPFRSQRLLRTTARWQRQTHFRVRWIASSQLRFFRRCKRCFLWPTRHQASASKYQRRQWQLTRMGRCPY